MSKIKPADYTQLPWGPDFPRGVSGKRRVGLKENSLK